MTQVSNSPVMTAEDPIIFDIRDRRVVLDRDVAAAFGAETKRINEARKRNPRKFSKDHAFKLTDTEFRQLRSQFATSKSGRGGMTRPPYVYTAKGVGRLAMILDTEQALEASDRILDTFLSIQQQVAQGQTAVTISSPSQILPSDSDLEAIADIRKQLARAVKLLLDSLLTAEEQNAVGIAARNLSRQIWEDIRERLRLKGLENAKLIADTELVLAEARKVNAEADGQHIDNFDKKIASVERLVKMYKAMEADFVMDLLGEMNTSRVAKRLE